MKESIIPALGAGTDAIRVGWLDRLCRRALLEKLRALGDGRLCIVEDTAREWLGEAAAHDAVTIHVHDPRFYALAALEGSVGAGEAYMRGYWSCSDLTTLVRLFVRNREVLESVEGGLAALSRPLLRAWHRLRRNTREGSRRNIAAHYDLGNDFYRLFLDETMTYSAALFERQDMTLAEASTAKLDRLCRKLDLRPTDHVLEIGTGWGSFALHAASRYGCRVTTTTISREQYNLARERVRQAGLQDRVTVLFQDYRDLTGTYDKIASIEMIEAVGWQYYGEFMAKCAWLLEPGGLLAMQAITIRDDVYDAARRSCDFIQRFIFPGSCIPSTTALVGAAADKSDLKLVHFEDMTPHYARTLREWRERFFAAERDVRALGYDDAFVRMWEFYLCYCEGGFAERHIASVQMVMARPHNRRDPILAAIA